MKYAILLVSLSMPLFAQTVLTVTERKVTVAGGQSYSSFKSNDEALKAASSLAAQACAVNPNSKVYGRITFEYACAKSSSSKSSSSSSSSAQSSASSVARVTATWKCSLEREDGKAMSESEIGGYYLKVGDLEPINLKHTGCDMSHIIDKPAPGVTVTIAEYDTDDKVSKYVAFE